MVYEIQLHGSGSVGDFAVVRGDLASLGSGTSFWHADCRRVRARAEGQAVRRRPGERDGLLGPGCPHGGPRLVLQRLETHLNIQKRI